MIGLVAVFLLGSVLAAGCNSSAPSEQGGPPAKPAVAPSPAPAQPAIPPAPEVSPPRILSLAPNVTEILFAMGLGDHVVGRTNFCDYPPEAAAVPSVGDTLQYDQEKIIALRPTIAFVITRREDLPKALEAMGIHTVALKSDRMDQLLEAIRTIGRETGRPEAAQALLDKIDKELARVRSLVKRLPRPRTLFAFPMMIGATQMGVAGRGTFVDDLLDVAGAENAYPDKADWPEITPEQAIALAPQVVIVNATGADADEGHAKAIDHAWNQWPTIPAVASHRVYILMEPYLTIPGPRVGQAAMRLAEVLHLGDVIAPPAPPASLPRPGMTSPEPEASPAAPEAAAPKPEATPLKLEATPLKPEAAAP
jgi:iron complex transport system substrate-binding protein